MREQVLYDKWYESEFARPDLRTYLPPWYAEQSDLVVPFLGKEYLTSDWCGLEWESVLDLIQRRENDAVMLCSLAGIRSEDVPGLHLGAGFVDINVKAQNEPQRVANLILERLQHVAPEAPPRSIGRLEDVRQIEYRTDLFELLRRARKEDWHELAILPTGIGQDRYIRHEMLEKAWPAEHIVRYKHRIGAAFVLHRVVELIFKFFQRPKPPVSNRWSQTSVQETARQNRLSQTMAQASHDSVSWRHVSR